MGSAIRRPGDLGTIYDKNGNGLGTYVDVAGVTQDIGTLTTAYTEQTTVPAPGGQVDYSHPFVGVRDAISMSVDIGLSAATSIQMKLQGRYDSSAAWADIQLVREDTGAVGAVVNGGRDLPGADRLDPGRLPDPGRRQEPGRGR